MSLPRVLRFFMSRLWAGFSSFWLGPIHVHNVNAAKFRTGRSLVDLDDPARARADHNGLPDLGGEAQGGPGPEFLAPGRSHELLAAISLVDQVDPNSLV